MYFNAQIKALTLAERRADRAHVRAVMAHEKLDRDETALVDISNSVRAEYVVAARDKPGMLASLRRLNQLEILHLKMVEKFVESDRRCTRTFAALLRASIRRAKYLIAHPETL
jgi:hypothetical protein